MRFSFQKAKFVAANKDEAKRAEWLQKIWPKIFRLSEKKNASILFGDEALFPQIGYIKLYMVSDRGATGYTNLRQ